jgi:hypothetical protein
MHAHTACPPCSTLYLTKSSKLSLQKNTRRLDGVAMLLIWETPLSRQIGSPPRRASLFMTGVRACTMLLIYTADAAVGL